MKNATEIAFVLDASGSMESIRSDAIGGFNSFLKEQQAVPGEARLSLLTFNTLFNWIEDSVPLQQARQLNEKTYVPMGATALLDAIGITVDRVGQGLRDLREADRPDKVVIAVFTDGQENSSTQYSKQRIAEMIDHQSQVYKWQFLFLAANIDAIATAATLNVKTMAAANFVQANINHAYAAAGSALRAYRLGEAGMVDLTSAKDERGFVLDPEEARKRTWARSVTQRGQDAK